jgi:hypothetical protein
MAIQLPYTLETYLGMILHDGECTPRSLPDEIANLAGICAEDDECESREEDPKAIYSALEKALPVSRWAHVKGQNPQDYVPPAIVTRTAVRYLRARDKFGRVRNAQKLYYSSALWYAGNLAACSQRVTNEDLKEYIRTRTRFDLEQAAAIVVSAMLTEGKEEEAMRLVQELGTVLATSRMWIENHQTCPVNKPDGSLGWKKLAQMLKGAAAHMQTEISLPSDFQGLVRALIRVRRCKPDNRCLYIPQWIFEQAGINTPSPFRDFIAEEERRKSAPRPGYYPTAAKGEDAIILSKRHFRCIQRRILQLYHFWKPEVVHATRVRDLADRVLYAGAWIEDRVFTTEDVALLCHFFFEFQRRLQRKIVGIYKEGFFAKGDGSRYYQNNLSIKSTFELVLQEIVESHEMGVLVTVGYEATLKLIDETCLLMKEYVDIYGAGNPKNLVFKEGKRGGSGRGPVDRYNLLCTVLRNLTIEARGEGVEDVPEPAKKFLAKDIMYWNKSWKDDAFAGRKEPSWRTWLRKRGLIDEDEWVMLW